MFNQTILKVAIILAVIGFSLSSCDRHTCPTYSQSESVKSEPKA
jgi:hypothetical protein